jgi:hypothetical protein
MSNDCGCRADCTCHGQRFEQDEHRAAPDSAPFESPPVLRVAALLLMPWLELLQWPGLLLARGRTPRSGPTRR